MSIAATGQDTTARIEVRLRCGSAAGAEGAVAALVLAAGTASRFRAADPSLPTKLVAPYRGLPLVRHAVVAALASRARPVVVVTGHAAGAVEAALRGLDVLSTFNPAFAAGLAGSLRTGLEALPATTAGTLVLLGDMPGVGAALIDRLIDAFACDPGAEAVVPIHGGRRGNPALIGRALFARAVALEGDEGARKLLAGARTREVGVGDAAVTLDVDDPETLRALSGGPTP